MTAVIVDMKLHITSNISHILCMTSNVKTELFTEATDTSDHL